MKMVFLENVCCPNCKGEINITRNNWDCPNCQEKWFIDSDNVIRLIDDSYSFSADKKGGNQLLNEIRNMSSQDFLNNIERLEKEYLDFSYEYCVSPTRADWTFLGDFSNKTVLELGSGYGPVSIYLAENGSKTVISVDATLERIKFGSIIAKMKNLKNISFIHGNVTSLPIKPKSVDSIVMVGLFEYSSSFTYSQRLSPKKKQLEFLKTLHDLLSENGEIWIGIENQLSYNHFLGKTYHGEIPFTPLLLKPLSNIIYKFARKQPYETYLWTKRGYIKLLKASGFTDIKFYYAFPDYKRPRFIASSSKNNIISKYLNKTFYNNPQLQKAQYLVKLMDKLGLLGLFSPAFFIKAKKEL
jgi:SAM-dependent methyltransferase